MKERTPGVRGGGRSVSEGVIQFTLFMDQTRYISYNVRNCTMHALQFCADMIGITKHGLW